MPVAASVPSSEWSPSSWRNYPQTHQPDWPDHAAYEAALKVVAHQPPLVFAGEVRELSGLLARVCRGEAFLLQGGDCVETFESFSADSVRDKLKVLLQMAAVLAFGAGVPVVKVGRIAGQFAKPRSKATETIGGLTLPTYRGPAVNDIEFTADARRADPDRVIRMYNQSAATLNLIRAFTHGGFADLQKVHVWNQEFVRERPGGLAYESLAREIDRALAFLSACGIDLDQPALRTSELYTSHDALLLGYEQALTRQDSLTGDWYDVSTHFPWIGERTRNPDGAHVHYFSGVQNPIGCKLGPTSTVEDMDAVFERLNPGNVPGRLTFIVRMGQDVVGHRLPALLHHAKSKGFNAIWSCDPMHGNTFTAATGHKTRHWDAIMSEIKTFFAVHRQEGTLPGGIFMELTGDNVTECIGGGSGLVESDLHDRYETACDPRLNNEQALEIAFELATLLRS